MTTLTHCTSTIAWRITTCTEPARIVSQSLIITLTFLAQVLSAFHLHPWSSTWLSLFDSTFSALYFCTFLLSVFLSLFFLFYLELSPELLYTKEMENLRHSAANESEDTYDVFNSPTCYEPKAHGFDELQNSSVPLSFKIPITDHDVDDLTLGEMLTEAYRGQVDYCVPGGVSVSQSVSQSLSVRFDGSGQLDGEMVDRSGQPDERNSSKTQITTLLEEQRQTILAECHARVSHHELQPDQAEDERRLLQGQLWQQKLEFREAHQRSLTEMEELRKFQSSAFDTIARRKLIEDQNTILEGIAKGSKLYERF